MAMDAIKQKIPTQTTFYRDKYHYFFYAMMIIEAILLVSVAFVLYQIGSRPIPEFHARQEDGKAMKLISFQEPNFLPDTIIRFASKAAVAAYTLDFVNYEKQLSEVKPFFTPGGWVDFNASMNDVIKTIVQNQLFVAGVVYGAPVISNQGPLPGKGYVWRIQIPFLVTYRSAGSASKNKYLVTVTIVHVPTRDNPQGIGIDQFVMK